VSEIGKIGPVGGLQEIPTRAGGAGGAEAAGATFGQALRDALATVDHLQKDSEAAQASYARGEEIDLHDVLIRIEEAEVAFKTMMEVRNKLVDAYREIMRMGV
jgi:flagellar hook-basal body complex protein FliE